ncbi:MAG: aminodeoxychorismate/anthranilate synthase component II [Deferribacterales bacterium]
MFLLIDNYDSFSYNLFALFRLAGAKIDVIRNTEFKPADGYKGIILSPGPSSPENSGTTLKYLEMYTGKIPMMGVCLGMQSMAYHLGYKVRKAKTVMHGKADDIVSVKPSKIFAGIPETFSAIRYHSLAADVPDSIKIAVAKSDGECMGMEDEANKLYGVQFHPESILSGYGDVMAKNFMNICGVTK